MRLLRRFSFPLGVWCLFCFGEVSSFLKQTLLQHQRSRGGEWHTSVGAKKNREIIIPPPLRDKSENWDPELHGSIGLQKADHQMMKTVEAERYLQEREEWFNETMRRRNASMPDVLVRQVKVGKLPVIAVVGRPNVGKSTLFNRISEQNRGGAIVDDFPGVTRDRTYRACRWNGYNFRAVDTGGLVFEDEPGLVFMDEIRQQVLLALEESKAAIFVVDGRGPPTLLDEEIASFLRKMKTQKGLQVILAVNKCESHLRGNDHVHDYWSLGLGTPTPVSGLTGSGVGDVLDLATERLDWVPDNEVMEAEDVNVAIIGKPNVGKSSLLNRFMGEQRAIVSDVAGTTRDAVDCLLERKNSTYRLVDTAGVRKKQKVATSEDQAEWLMVNRAVKAIKRADVCLLVLDVVAGISDQDKELADKILDMGKACVVVCNKWDAVDKDETTYEKAVSYVKAMIPHIKFCKVLFCSAKTGQRLPQIFQAVDAAVEEHRRRVPTHLVNEVVRETVQLHPPPVIKGKQGKIYLAQQVGCRPPTFTLFCNQGGLFAEPYRKYLERKMRDAFGFEGTPVRWLFRGKKARDFEGKLGSTSGRREPVKAAVAARRKSRSDKEKQERSLERQAEIEEEERTSPDRIGGLAFM
mmetsp:Transcript_22420/g.44412  ORF Transcript_22420/g.44412 Transcript_22420/m.44412 type:complete len:634 (+) Transcript_22420:279-2180(+)